MVKMEVNLEKIKAHLYDLEVKNRFISMILDHDLPLGYKHTSKRL